MPKSTSSKTTKSKKTSKPKKKTSISMNKLEVFIKSKDLTSRSFAMEAKISYRNFLNWIKKREGSSILFDKIAARWPELNMNYFFKEGERMYTSEVEDTGEIDFHTRLATLEKKVEQLGK